MIKIYLSRKARIKKIFKKTKKKRFKKSTTTKTSLKKKKERKDVTFFFDWLRSKSPFLFLLENKYFSKVSQQMVQEKNMYRMTYENTPIHIYIQVCVCVRAGE